MHVLLQLELCTFLLVPCKACLPASAPLLNLCGSLSSGPVCCEVPLGHELPPFAAKTAVDAELAKVGEAYMNLADPVFLFLAYLGPQVHAVAAVVLVSRCQVGMAVRYQRRVTMFQIVC